MSTLDEANLIIVGAGFYGATIAERAANESGLKVVVVERRNHVGGNAYSYCDPVTGIEIHRYGPHIFHTTNETVWNYLNRFTAFSSYRHRAWTVYRGEVFPLPINLATICQFFRKHMSPDEARTLILEQASEYRNITPSNFEEKAIFTIGRPLYEAFFRGYTKKQWQTDPRELPASVFSRLPVRFNFDNRYFSDKFEGMPMDGYTAVFQRMLEHRNIQVILDTDWFSIRPSVPKQTPVIFTGPIDRYFDYAEGKLGWRTTEFQQSVVRTDNFQGTPILNFADEEIPHTRIVEYRHFYPERPYPSDLSVIIYEYSKSAFGNDEPYYPINTRTDKDLYSRYLERARNTHNVFFGGRLGTYRYLDMHQAIGAALKDWDRIKLAVFNRMP